MESEFLSLQKFLMKGIGLSWSSKNSFVNHKLVFMAGFASMTSIILAMAAYIYENSEDLGKITDASTLMLQGSTSLLKTICFLVYKKEFKNIYYKLYDIYKKANNEFKTSIDILKSFHDKSRRISKAYVWLCILAGGSAQLVPLVRSSISYLQTRDTFQRLLPYLAIYPLDVSVPEYYALSYIWCISATYAVALMNCIVDTIVTTFSYSISGHFQSVNQEFQENFRNNNDVIRNFNRIIKYHNEVLQLFEEFRSITALIILAEYGISSLQICVVAYQITLHPLDPKIMFLVIYAIAILVQVCMYSYSGNLLEDCSSKIGEGVTSCDWDNVSFKIGKSISMVIQRSQRPCILKGYFFTADLPNLMWMMKTAGSFITLLKSME